MRGRERGEWKREGRGKKEGRKRKRRTNKRRIWIKSKRRRTSECTTKRSRTKEKTK